MHNIILATEKGIQPKIGDLVEINNSKFRKFNITGKVVGFVNKKDSPDIYQDRYCVVYLNKPVFLKNEDDVSLNFATYWLVMSASQLNLIK